MHPFVLGEVALGSMAARAIILHALGKLPAADVATNGEVLQFIERNQLFGRGIGYVDCHLLASAKLTSGARIWTRDKRLEAVAQGLGLAASGGLE